MKIHEYQAKELLSRFGVPVPRGRLATTAVEAEVAARALGTPVVVLKAQIHAGGRGKAGGVKVLRDLERVKEEADTILGRTLVTHQTGPAGRLVRRLYVEEGTAVARELYLGMVLDRAREQPVLMASTEGGVEIEEVAARSPEKILKEWVDPVAGLDPFLARRMAFRLGLSGQTAAHAARLIEAVGRAFFGSDASMVEINPLVITESGAVIALDAKVGLDDNALDRHPELAAYRDMDEEEPTETRAADAGLSYVKLDGEIGCLVNGAGLAMSTMDAIKLHGGNPANFLDVGGGATREQVTEAFRIILEDPNVLAILVNIFGGIMKCDVIAEGIIAAVQSVSLGVPLVVRLEGTNVAEGRRMLAESGLPIITATDMTAAARRVVGAAQEKRA